MLQRVVRSFRRPTVPEQSARSVYFLVRLDDFRLDDLRLELFRLEALRDEDFFFGTRAPLRRASDSPMAIACLRLVTLFFDVAPRFNVPRFLSRIAFATFF